MLGATKLLNEVWKPIKMISRNKPYPVPFVRYLKNLQPMQVTKLSNGLTVATEERECYNACVGFYIDGGSRYENTSENGITHFFEHIAFKCTRSRLKSVLKEQMSSTGAQFRCFTTREMIAYYAECLSQDVPLIMDILSDCLFNNNFSLFDIEQQKKTVILEMEEHDCDPNALLDDYLHSAAFQGTPLAQTVLGPCCNLHNFKAATLCKYMAKCFDPARTVLAVVGGVKHNQVVALAEQFLSKIDSVKRIDNNVYRYTGSDFRFRDDSMPVAHCVIAVEGPNFSDDDKIILDIAAGVVSGWDRSQPGGIDHAVKVARVVSSGHFCDSYKSIYLTYKDTGLWGIKFMGPALELDDMVLAVQDEWMYLCNYITEGEIKRAKRQLKTKLLSKTESAVGTCHDIGRWILYNGYRPPIHEQICAIDKVYSKNVREVCTKYLYDKCPVVVAMGPIECLSEYNRIRAGMYWLRI